MKKHIDWDQVERTERTLAWRIMCEYMKERRSFYAREEGIPEKRRGISESILNDERIMVSK